MKIEIEDEEITIFLKLEEIENFNFEDIEEVEDYFRTLFLKLEECYHIEIEGFYNIQVFLDKEEGMVLKLEREDIDYYHTFHQVEMRILKEECVFLYEIEDALDFLLTENDIYYYKNKFYLKKRQKNKVYNVYEFGKLIYEDTDTILKRGMLLNKK